MANRNLSTTGRLLLALKISSVEARFIAICALAFIVLLGWLAWSFQHSPAGLNDRDVVFFIGTSLLAAIVMLAAGWLGFTPSGRHYSEELFRGEVREVKAVRLVKVAFAVGASTFAVFIVLFVILLFVGGAELVTIFFDGTILGVTYGLLVLICFPFVKKYLK